MSVDADAGSHGQIRYGRWHAYPWKNELVVQRDRVVQHLDELATEAEVEHDPHAMLVRALGVAAFCMRRLIECALVTDLFVETGLSVHEIRSTDGDFREPFHGDTGGNFFRNYDLTQRIRCEHRPKHIADKLLHARIVAVLSGSGFLEDGLLVASDHQFGTSLFHMTAAEFRAIVQAFLENEVRLATDEIDIASGRAKRSRR